MKGAREWVTREQLDIPQDSGEKNQHPEGTSFVEKSTVGLKEEEMEAVAEVKLMNEIQNVEMGAKHVETNSDKMAVNDSRLEVEHLD